ncbi:unnamed protein product [Adineta steineri]|uniref:Uncharacterized protein n=1 Tax=Adineta steineri TaxID=433720 RepID=A0A815EB39_9BILA|nr:unnamed protein product [Adineta steineri]CAF1578459.1 unnamed protein product [Adineta steineri]
MHYSDWISNINRPPLVLLEELLQNLAINLTHQMGIDSLSSTSHTCLISNCQLIIAGNDLDYAVPIQAAFSFLNSPTFEFSKMSNDYKGDVYMLTNQLVNNVIILKSVIRGSYASSTSRDSDILGGFLYYSCLDMNMVVGLEVLHGGICENVAMLQMNVVETKIKAIKWHIQTKLIEKLKSRFANDNKFIQRLEASLLLIPQHVFVTCPYHSLNVKVGINGFDHIDQLIFRCAVE